VAKGAPADLVSEHSQPPTLIIGQSNAMTAQLRLQGPVLFAKKIDDSPLLTLDASKERHEQEVEWKHASESIRIEVDAVFRHYGVTHYNQGRPHASLGPGFPEASAAQNSLVAPGHHVPARCRVVAAPILSGLHHEYRWVPEAA